jgi:hypothetical protein
MKKLNKFYLLGAITLLSVGINSFNTYAVEEKKRYRTGVCQVTHEGGSTSAGTECKIVDASGPCATTSACTY